MYWIIRCFLLMMQLRFPEMEVICYPAEFWEVIPFKRCQSNPPQTVRQCLSSGSTVGIYMETDGVLVIDTGEIISEEGRAEEPAEKIIEPGDYIVAFNDEIIETKKIL